MENTEPTIVETYFSYWQEHIQPIPEEKIRAQFNEILINVAGRLHGIHSALELAFLLLKEQNADLVGEAAMD